MTWIWSNHSLVLMFFEFLLLRRVPRLPTACSHHCVVPWSKSIDLYVILVFSASGALWIQGHGTTQPPNSRGQIERWLYILCENFKKNGWVIWLYKGLRLLEPFLRLNLYLMSSFRGWRLGYNDSTIVAEKSQPCQIDSRKAIWWDSSEKSRCACARRKSYTNRSEYGNENMKKTRLKVP